MMKKTLSLALGLLLLLYYQVIPASAVQNRPSQPQSAAKIKQKITKIGIETYLKITLNNGREFKGFIKKINEDNFDMVWGYSGQPLENKISISYSEVKKVKDLSIHGKDPTLFIVIVSIVIFVGTILSAAKRK